jgi:hypothetical protein
MTLHSSPYVTSRPVTGVKFYDRDQLIAEITNVPGAFYVLGTRQIGKTSLLHELAERVPAILLDVQLVGGQSNGLDYLAWQQVRIKRKRYTWFPLERTLKGADLFALLGDVNEAAGHPLFLQLLGERLFEEGRLRQPTEGDLMGIVDQADKTGIFDRDWRASSPLEQIALRRVSEAGRVPAGEMAKLVSAAMLDGLTVLGFLRRIDDTYAIGNEFLSRWLVEAQPWDRPSTVSNESALSVYEQTQLEPVLAAVRQNQIALAEMEHILDAIRRVLVAWQREGLPEPDAQTRTTLTKIEAAVASKGGTQHKLEATLPLLPLLPPSLVYKVEWSGEMRASLDLLQKQLDELKRKLIAST